jgi:excinuclease ABC subunit C
VLSFREGLLIAKRHYLIRRSAWDVSRDSADELVLQYYLNHPDELPPELMLPHDGAFDSEILNRWFDEQLSHHVRITVPQRGAKIDLVRMAEQNARLFLAQKAPPDARADLEDLQRALQLPRLPETIEAFDISNLGESFAVAGMVQFTGGRPNKSGYRRYKMRTVEGQNDFAMMMEAVTRRLERLDREGKPFPDLLLIDGGKGQLHAAMQPLQRFTEPPMIISLAKQEEIIHSPYAEEPVALPETHPARRLVERIRDEVHRYAITYHRTIRDRQFKRSSLEEIPGIGAKRAKALLRRFGSVKRIREATVAELAGAPGMSRPAAEALAAVLRENAAAERQG